MKEVDIRELNSSEDIKKYSSDTIFVLKDDKVFLPPKAEKDKNERR